MATNVVCFISNIYILPCNLIWRVKEPIKAELNWFISKILLPVLILKHFHKLVLIDEMEFAIFICD